MRTGLVKQFAEKASFGFIEDDQNHKSYFVFYTAIKEEGYKRLEVGQREIGRASCRERVSSPV